MSHQFPEIIHEVAQTLEAPSHQDATELAVTLSFVDRSSLTTAEWATRKFGAALVDDKIIAEYNQNPEVDDRGHKIPVEDLGGKKGEKLQLELEAGREEAVDVADDLRLAHKRAVRGYELGQLLVHGTQDTAIIIGALERASGIEPENFESEGERHHQAAARYMLDHLQVVETDIGNSKSYLL